MEWIRIFNCFGMEELSGTLPNQYRRDESVRHEKIATMTKRLIEIIHHKPNHYGVNRSSWNRQALAQVYNEQFGENISATAVPWIV